MDSLVSDAFLDLADGVWDKDGLPMLDDTDIGLDFLEGCIDDEFDVLHISESDIVGDINFVDRSKLKPTAESNDISSIGAQQNSCTKQMEIVACDRLKLDRSPLPVSINQSRHATCENTEFQAEYNRALRNLAFSMQKSDSTRKQIIYQRQKQGTQFYNRNIIHTSHQSLSGLDDLLSGRSSTLTIALEQSRNQLKSYMDIVHKNIPPV